MYVNSYEHSQLRDIDYNQYSVRTDFPTLVTVFKTVSECYCIVL